MCRCVSVGVRAIDCAARIHRVPEALFVLSENDNSFADKPARNLTTGTRARSLLAATVETCSKSWFVRTQLRAVVVLVAVLRILSTPVARIFLPSGITHSMVVSTTGPKPLARVRCLGDVGSRMAVKERRLL